jgi:Gas vesicle protein
MKRRTPTRRPPPKSVTRSTMTTRSGHSTVRRSSLDAFAKPPLPFRPAARPPKAQHATRQIAHIVDERESSLIDLIDNLLAKGVMINADLILALANVDLVYIRLSALLCAADRVLPGRAR